MAKVDKKPDLRKHPAHGLATAIAKTNGHSHPEEWADQVVKHLEGIADDDGEGEGESSGAGESTQQQGG